MIRLLLSLVGVGGGGAAMLPLIAVGLTALGGLFWWASSAWHDFKMGLIEQGKQECRGAVERATSEARAAHIGELQRQAQEFANKLRATEEARQRAIEDVRSLSTEQRGVHEELTRLRSQKAPLPADCALTDEQIDVLNKDRKPGAAPAKAIVPPAPKLAVPPPPPKGKS